MDSETLIVDATAEPRRRRPRIGVKDVLCVGPIILNSIYYYAGIPLTPLLLGRNPVLLSALRGTLRSHGGLHERAVPMIVTHPLAAGALCG